MFCYQCQEAAKNEGCQIRGVCGKTEDTAALQDLLVYSLKAVSLYMMEETKSGNYRREIGSFVEDCLFATITNANFDRARFKEMIDRSIEIRMNLEEQYNIDSAHGSLNLVKQSLEEYEKLGTQNGIKAQTDNNDVESLRELLTYGLKGMAAYSHHARMLGEVDDAIPQFIIEALASTTQDLNQEQMIGYVMKTGELAVTTMALLDKANTTTYGAPEMTSVNLKPHKNPGILISGHDLSDMKELLEQTKGTGVDVYTHCEMLPAHYYPEFKKYDNLIAHYGGAWWKQDKEFTSFNGPILMTTNCITPVKKEYKDRIYTTGVVGFEGIQHLESVNGKKDFSKLIEQAKNCAAPTEIESGEIIGGFAHQQVLALADKVVDAVKSGAVKKFVVMAGCDGRSKEREYYTDVAKQLPADSIILTAGCAKFRYNKLDLGDIGGIPRVLDAGQCNDSYSLAVTALKLQEVFGLENINDLPIEYDIAWYEQKAVTVLLALLHLGVKGIRLGPTLPAFLSPNVAKVLVETFDIKGIGTAEADVQEMMA
jgi:hydroxylamine reductase